MFLLGYKVISMETETYFSRKWESEWLDSQPYPQNPIQSIKFLKIYIGVAKKFFRNITSYGKTQTNFLPIPIVLQNLGPITIITMLYWKY